MKTFHTSSVELVAVGAAAAVGDGSRSELRTGCCTGVGTDEVDECDDGLEEEEADVLVTDGSWCRRSCSNRRCWPADTAVGAAATPPSPEKMLVQ